jgi:hypothetical protein
MTRNDVVEELREDKELMPTNTSQETRAMLKAAWNYDAPSGI